LADAAAAGPQCSAPMICVVEYISDSAQLLRMTKRYFFHLDKGKEVPDLLGQELCDLQAAREEAMREARQMALDELRAGKVDLSHAVVVTDQFDKVLLVVRTEEALRSAPEPRHADSTASPALHA
jgi:hypothetical protein